MIFMCDSNSIKSSLSSDPHHPWMDHSHFCTLQWRQNKRDDVSTNQPYTIVYSTVYSSADQRKHHNSASLTLCREFTGDHWILRTTKGQLRRKCFHLMRSSCMPNSTIVVLCAEFCINHCITVSMRAKSYFNQIWTMSHERHGIVNSSNSPVCSTGCS